MIILPQCYLQYFYIPALDKSLNSPHNTSIYLDLKLENYNPDKEDICYDYINITLSYINSQSYNNSIASTTIPSFCQAEGTIKKHVNFTVDQGLNWTIMFHDWAVSDNQTMVEAFRLNLSTAVRARYLFWRNKKKNSLKAAANVEVNELGLKVKKRDIYFSGAGCGYNCNFGLSFLSPAGLMFVHLLVSVF